MVCDGNKSLSRKESGDNKVTYLEIIALECGSVYERRKSELSPFAGSVQLGSFVY